jgi:hypothetical protein
MGGEGGLTARCRTSTGMAVGDSSQQTDDKTPTAGCRAQGEHGEHRAHREQGRCGGGLGGL